MKYYIKCEGKFPVGDYPITEKQKVTLYVQDLIYLAFIDETGIFYRMANGICFDDIEKALNE
jgi:hypothetical protein